MLPKNTIKRWNKPWQYLSAVNRKTFHPLKTTATLQVFGLSHNYEDCRGSRVMNFLSHFVRSAGRGDDSGSEPDKCPGCTLLSSGGRVPSQHWHADDLLTFSAELLFSAADGCSDQAKVQGMLARSLCASKPSRGSVSALCGGWWRGWIPLAWRWYLERTLDTWRSSLHLACERQKRKEDIYCWCYLNKIIIYSI